MSEPLNIVLLGATGFTGSAILRYASALPAGVLHVRALVRGSGRLTSKCEAVFQGDVRSLPDALFPKAPHVVVHLATKRIDHDGSGFEENNVQGARQLMRRLNEHCRGVVYASSASVYGQGAHYAVDENSPLHPETELAISRARAEEIIVNVTESLGIGAFCVRPRFVLGRGDRHTFPGLIRMIRRGIQPGSGNQRFTIIDVDDYARLLMDLAARLLHAPERLAVNAGYTQSVSLAEIVRVLCSHFGLMPPRMHFPVSIRATRNLRHAPFRQLRTLATRLELFGLPHTFSVERLRGLTNCSITGRDPKPVLEAAAAALAEAP